MVAKGTYYVFAYIDQNGNLIYDAGEPAGQYGEPKAVAAPAGGVVQNINLTRCISRRTAWGGLIARSFIQDFYIEFPFVKLFISLATPWGGDKMAEHGVKQSPAVIPCWIDMQPQGNFIQSIYRKKMPSTVSFYMFYGHRGSRNPFRSNNDGTITLSSLLDRRPQADAKMSYAFDEDYASIIYSEEVLDQYNAIINTFDAKHRATSHLSAGYIKLNFAYNYPGDSARPWPKLILRPVSKRQKETVVALSPEDNGKKLGPFPCGSYSASLYADGVKSQQKWVPFSIESDHTKELSFVLIPDGMISGYIETATEPENKVVGMPGWQKRVEDNTIQLESITLKGIGVHRTLYPYQKKDFNRHDMEISRTDYCGKGYFRFFGLPAGQYELAIKAKDHKPFSTTQMVIPGKQGAFRFYELTPEI